MFNSGVLQTLNYLEERCVEPSTQLVSEVTGRLCVLGEFKEKDLNFSFFTCNSHFTVAINHLKMTVIML